MPRRNRRQSTNISNHEVVILFLIALCVLLFIFHMEIVVYITIGAFVLETIWLIIRKFQNRPLTGQQVRRLDVSLVALFVILSIVWVTDIQVVFGVVVGVLAVLFILWKAISSQKRKVITSDIESKLSKALQLMDSTAKWYNNEDEANRELVTCLKSLNVDAAYGYKLPNGRIADAKVGDMLIEGKLSPDTAEVDRLIGQLSDYTQYGDKLNVVIYGQLSNNARRRIENEIHLKYIGRVFLTYLNNPQRKRTQVML